MNKNIYYIVITTLFLGVVFFCSLISSIDYGEDYYYYKTKINGSTLGEITYIYTEGSNKYVSYCMDVYFQVDTNKILKTFYGTKEDKIGDKVKIYYSKENPKIVFNISDDEFRKRLYFRLFVCLFSLFFLVKQINSVIKNRAKIIYDLPRWYQTW